MVLHLSYSGPTFGLCALTPLQILVLATFSVRLGLDISHKSMLVTHLWVRAIELSDLVRFGTAIRCLFTACSLLIRCPGQTSITTSCQHCDLLVNSWPQIALNTRVSAWPYSRVGNEFGSWRPRMVRHLQDRLRSVEFGITKVTTLPSCVLSHLCCRDVIVN